MTTTTDRLPAAIRDVEHLDDLLSEPSPGAIETLRRLQGDLLIVMPAPRLSAPPATGSPVANFGTRGYNQNPFRDTLTDGRCRPR